MVDIALSLYGTLCAIGYLTLSVLLAVVSIFLFVCLVGVASQLLESGAASWRAGDEPRTEDVPHGSPFASQLRALTPFDRKLACGASYVEAASGPRYGSRSDPGAATPHGAPERACVR